MSGARHIADGDAQDSDGGDTAQAEDTGLLSPIEIDVPDRSPSRSPLSQIQQEEDLFNSSSSGEVGTALRGGTYKRLKEAAGARNDDASGSQAEDDENEEESTPIVSQRPTMPDVRPETPSEDPSTPDDTPSRRGSFMSSPGSASQLSVARQRRPGGLAPFDRRFSSQLSTTTTNKSPRPSSPAFLASHSRQSSLASLGNDEDASVASAEIQAPWEVVRWLRLRKLTGTAFSEVGKRNYGRPTCLAVANSIVIGTSRGLILVFDYHQNLLATIGLGTKAVEAGAVSSLAISADHSTIAGGHTSGHIFTWEVARPAKPFLHIPPIPVKDLSSRTTDGHVAEKGVLHIGFLGTRHTALVSADEAGMAFSHLATRGLGAVGRVVKTVRILGRYPQPPVVGERPKKASSVLAFGPLPLGNVEQPTDNLGLTALLTPYLLVIVSTTPIAQTQHKAPRPKDVEPHSTLSGCLAWFPAVKLKTPNEKRQTVSRTKLAYSWANVLTVLDVEASFSPDEDRPPDYNFRPRARWKHDEAIVALQWLSRSVLGVLTISQRLVIVEDNNGLKATDSYDLLQKHIYHRDLYSQQLRSVVENLNEEDASMHGVVADAFHMSFRAYKGRLFLLGFEDVEMGTLSNWADRLVALMEEGNYIAALELATAYYNGDTSKLTVGLPDDATSRHNIVRERLLEMIAASLKFSFGEQSSGTNGTHLRASTRDLASACFTACTSMGELDFLFDDVFERFSDASHDDVFFETLEPYVLEKKITSIPPGVMQALVSQYASSDRAARLQDMICRLDPSTFDIDHSITLCKQYQLFDALIYIYNQALHDFVSPLVEMLALLDMFKDDGIPRQYEESIVKLFPYLAYSLVGRYYPGSDFMDDGLADQAKADLYRFIFSGRAVEWPPGSGEIFLAENRALYPYLRSILTLDTASFLSVLNEAFEDAFLNGPSDLSNGNFMNGDHSRSKQSFANLPTRQTIISILMDVMSGGDFDAEDTIYLDMFIARNLPKFPQYIMLPGSALHDVLEGLCRYPSDDVAADCQLSVEYLLSQYRPSDMSALIPLFQEAQFYRVLRTVYRAAKEYGKLLEASFADTTESDVVLENVTDCLRLGGSMTSKQRHDVETVVLEHARDLVSINTVRVAQIFTQHAPELFEKVLSAIENDSHAQYIMLQTVLEPDPISLPSQRATEMHNELAKRFEEQYVRLMCSFNPLHVADHVSLLKSGDLRLDAVLPAMEESGVIDAAIKLLARDGLSEAAMARLVKHLSTLRVAITNLIAQSESAEATSSQDAIEDLLSTLEKYAQVGIWLCQGQTRARAAERPPPSHRRTASIAAAVNEKDLYPDERLWLDLIDAVASTTKDINGVISDDSDTSDTSAKAQTQLITTATRNIVQQTFSALLASTTSFTQSSKSIAATIGPPQQSSSDVATNIATTHSSTQGSSQRPPLNTRPSQSPTNPSFLRIFRCFLSRTSARLPTLSDLRAVLTDIFAAYTFEATILELSNQFLDKDVFLNVQEGYQQRLRGWKPRSSTCEVCERKVWGPGAGGGVFDTWEKKRDEEDVGRYEKMSTAPLLEGASGKARERSRSRDPKGKGKAVEEAVETPPGTGTLVVFACGHVSHRSCLAQVQHADEGGQGRFVCTVCV